MEDNFNVTTDSLLDDVLLLIQPDPWATAKRWSKTCVYIGFYGNMISLPIGIILNLVSVVIFLKNKMWKTAVGLHLIFLGLADALECFSAIFMTFWPFGRTVIPGYLYPIDKFEFMCKGAIYLRDVGWHFSSLLTVSATVERYLSLAYPLKVSGWKLRSKSKPLIALYLISSFLLPLYVHFTYSPAERSFGVICTRTPGTQDLFDAFNIAVKRTFSTLFLGAFIFVLTCLMSKELYKQRKARKAMTGASARGASKQPDKEKQIAIMMYIIAIVFIATKIPYMIAQYTRTYGFKKINVNIYIFLNDLLPVSVTVNYLNFVVNFFVYYHYMASFRKVFQHIFCCKSEDAKNKSNMSSGISTSVSSISKSVDNIK